MESSSPPVEETNDENLVIGQGRGQMMEKEHMFDKVVTPSDVGKLNRLVIPKQHAEKYFPFDSSANEKGLLLNFEDRNGKPWRFRYSYWNSSQSYVMTKGWSRFVKEKKLDAGDIVSFLRGVGELGKDVLFIDWRRRPDALQSSVLPSSMIRGHHYLSFPHPLNHPYYLRCRDHPTIPHHHHHQLHMTTSSSSYGMVLNENHFQSPHQLVRTGVGIGMMMQMQRGGCGGGGCGDEIDEDEPLVFESVPVVQGKKAVGKRLRLFGVNMECPISESSEIILPSTAVTANYPITGSASSSSTKPYPSSYINTAAPMSSNKILNKSKGSLSLDFDV